MPGRYPLRSLAKRPLRYWLPHEVRDRMLTEYEVVWNYLWPPMSEPRDAEELFDLENKSGAKAFIVSGRRRLDRRFGAWLARQKPSTAS